ncbi:MAG TPA: metalloregulator ArsR/SmtB family transcription factor [Ramlibacter sp.]|nr:metalloregulator ArsR/SmtB family transcription factor [Ramlibacter sp.]
MDALRGQDAAALERAAEVFSLLSASSRLRILVALCDQELCVGDLAVAVDLPQPTVSQQLALLFRAGLLARRREGSQVHYSVERKTRDFLCGAVHALVG